MKYRDAQLITQFTKLDIDGKLMYQDRPVDSISVSQWEEWLNEESDADKKIFFSIMLQRALKAKKPQPQGGK